jgi:hypothetical protein
MNMQLKISTLAMFLALTFCFQTEGFCQKSKWSNLKNATKQLKQIKQLTQLKQLMTEKKCSKGQQNLKNKGL